MHLFNFQKKKKNENKNVFLNSPILTTDKKPQFDCKICFFFRDKSTLSAIFSRLA